MHKICLALACALGTATAAELNFYTQSAEEMCAIRTAILAGMGAYDFKDAAQARRSLETLRGLLKEYGMPAGEIQSRTASLEEGIKEHFKKREQTLE